MNKLRKFRGCVCWDDKPLSRKDSSSQTFEKIDELVKDQSGNYVTRSKILSTPHTFFKTIKKNYPSYVHNKAKNGSPVVIEKFGEINIKKLHEANITSDLIIWHYLYCYEWQWNHLTPSETLKNLSIYDVKRINTLTASKFF